MKRRSNIHSRFSLSGAGSSLTEMDHFAMNFTNHSNKTGAGENLLIIIPNPNLGIVQASFFTTLSLLLVVAALASNIFLVASLAKKSPVPYFNLLIIILSAADIMKSCLHFSIYTVSTPLGSWFLGSMMCKFLPSFLQGSEIYSVMILTMISRNRCRAICNPLQQANLKKRWLYLELCFHATFCFGYEFWTKFQRCNQYHIGGETRCVDTIENKGKSSIIAMYFTYIGTALFHKTFHFIRVAYTLRKNSKHLAENKLESSQRLKRNKKAIKTIFIMVVVYDVVLVPTAVLQTLALYFTALTEFRELSQILVLLYCSFNSVFYIWRDEKLKATAKQFFAKLFRRR